MRARVAVGAGLASLVIAAGAGYWLGLRGPAESKAPANLGSADVAAPVSRRAPVASAGDTGASEAPQAAGDAPRTSPGAELNREGIAALDAGDVPRAVELFDAALAADPGEPILRHNLAEALARRALRERETRRPCDECVAWLARAVELAPEREPLAAALARWRKEDAAESEFWRDSSQHFDLSYDGDRTQILHGAGRLLDTLERDYADLAELFGDRPAESGRRRLAVVLYRREQFGDLTGLGDWAAGSFDGVIRIPIEDLAREELGLGDVLRHELVHAFVREVGGPSVPGWLNEGLAQWLESDSEADVAAARLSLAPDALFPLDQLAPSLATWKDPDAITRAYAQSLAFCDYLARTYGEQALFRMVTSCGRGESPADSFRSWTRVELDLALADFTAGLDSGR